MFTSNKMLKIDNEHRFAHTLLVPTQTVIIPLLANAMTIEQKFNVYMEDEPHGIYRLGDTEPVIVSGQDYYFLSNNPLTGKNQMIPITDFDSSFNLSTSHVCNASGKIVIFDYMMKNKQKYLNNYPSIPTRSIIILEMVIRNLISRMSEYDNRANFDREIQNLLLPEYQYLQDQNVFEDYATEIVQKTLNFVGEDTWHIYNVRAHGPDVTLEKTIDFRIYEYHRRLDQEYQAAIDRANGNY